MNKIIQININGMVFSIDEHAYEELKQYLDRLRSHFRSIEGGHEIITDIEARIAELLLARLNAQKQVVGEADIKEVIAIMGDPSQMAAEEEQQSKTEEPKVHYTSFEKRLFRDPDDRVFGGVCSGLGAYFGIEPVWIRLGFAFAFFALGTGLLLYIILWVVIPKANTTTEKLQMRGKPVDITNIEKKIKEELKDVEAQFSEFAKTSRPKAQDGFRRVTEVLIKVVAMFALAVSRLAGFFIALISILLFITLIGVLLGLSWPVSFSPFTFLEMLFANNNMLYLGLAGFLLVSIVPLVFLVYVGVKLLFNLKFKNKYFNRVAASFFWVGLILAFIGGVYLAKEFSAGTKTSTNIPLAAANADTLYVDVQEMSSSLQGDRVSMGDMHLTLFDDDTFLIEGVEVRIEQSDKNVFELVREVHSRGKSISEAVASAKLANPQIDQNDSTLVFHSGFKLSKNKAWRGQKVEYKLKVPAGKTVKFMNGADQILINEGEVFSNTSWTMTASGFTCNNCESIQVLAKGKYHKNYTVQSFSNIDVSGVFDVHVMRGATHQVTVNAQEAEDLKHVLISVKGNTLQIEMDRHFTSIFKGIKGKRIEVHVEVPELDELKASGANEVYLHQLNSKKLFLDLSGACSVKGMNLRVDDLKVDMSGASKVKLDGSGGELTADLSGACDLEAEEFTCKNVSVDCSGASSAQVNASSSLKVDASGTSHIEYTGKPALKYINKSGAADVKPED